MEAWEASSHLGGLFLAEVYGSVGKQVEEQKRQ